MTYKIIILAIEALAKAASSKGNSVHFSRDIDQAIQSLKKVKQYF